jgi:hypothetical protein
MILGVTHVLSSPYSQLGNIAQCFGGLSEQGSSINNVYLMGFPVVVVVVIECRQKDPVIKNSHFGPVG